MNWGAYNFLRFINLPEWLGLVVFAAIVVLFWRHGDRLHRPSRKLSIKESEVNEQKTPQTRNGTIR